MGDNTLQMKKVKSKTADKLRESRTNSNPDILNEGKSAILFSFCKAAYELELEVDVQGVSGVNTGKIAAYDMFNIALDTDHGLVIITKSSIHEVSLHNRNEVEVPLLQIFDKRLDGYFKENIPSKSKK